MPNDQNGHIRWPAALVMLALLLATIGGTTLFIVSHANSGDTRIEDNSKARHTAAVRLFEKLERRLEAIQKDQQEILKSQIELGVTIRDHIRWDERGRNPKR